jgi:hypothetical protein
MLQLPQRFCFNLPNTFTYHRELLADFFQCVVGVHADAKAHAQHPFFAWRQAGQHAGCGFVQVRLDGGVDGEMALLLVWWDEGLGE